MFYRKLIFYLFLSILSVRAFSAVFVVTSNADSGPGTLREAMTLAAANGNSSNYINFNLPGLSQGFQTITINSLLPDISPNLVIDASSQPGPGFGVSNAKVKILATYTNTSSNSMYVFNGNNVADFSMSALDVASIYQYSYNNNLINITNSGNININNCLIESGAVNIYNCLSFAFQTNMFGYLSDGITGLKSAIDVDNTPNVVIGGNSSQGNLLSGAVNLNMDNPAQDWTYLISNNKIGTDYTGTISSSQLFSTYGRITIQSGLYSPPSPGKMHGIITGNIVANFQGAGIFVDGFGNVDIKGNSIDTDPSGKINFTSFGSYGIFAPTAIWLQGGVDAIVGGSNPGDSNIIGYTNNGILEQLANTVVISQNSIFCLAASFYNPHDFVTSAYPKPLPQVQINPFTSSGISGTATPGARVELFSNVEGECPSCDPRDFFTYVTADSQGNWSYTGSIPTDIVASAIFNGQTSLFTRPTLISANLTIKQPHCGDNTGSITGFKFYNASQIRWFDQNGNVISNSLDINNLPPGRYMLKVGSDVCGTTSNWIDLLDNSLKADASNLKVVNPSCNKNGAISGILVSTAQNEQITYVWTDQNAKQVGTTPGISNLLAGNYTLTATGVTTGCSTTYGPVTLTNSIGPVIDQSKANITSTICNQSTGSITGITATGSGNLVYNWQNAQQQLVGNTADLLNQPAGTYTLHVTDGSQCGAIYSAAIVIPAINGITMDESNVQTLIAGCGFNNGSVTGILVTGATQFQWTDAIHQVVSSALNLTNAAPGDYVLTASNSSGCSKISMPYHIGQTIPTNFPSYSSTIVDACFSTNNGAVSIITDALVKAERWVDSQGNTVGNNALLNNIIAGTYKLYLTDQNGCESYYNSYTINELPLLRIMDGGQTIDDMCGLKTGNIGSVNPTGGLPPYTYKWTDANGQQISTANSLSNLAAGSYTLNITDSKCGSVSFTYELYNGEENINAPSVSDIQLCSSGDALLTVNNSSSSATYLLYDTQGAQTPLDIEKGGKFKVNITKNRSYYISEVNGTCESSRSQINVSVSLSVLTVPNAITPNGDGINDYWNISGIENYPAAVVKIYDRYGQIIFESRGYPKPFDGNLNGKQLPGGVYYYVINLGTNCSLLSGSLTIIR